MHSTKTPSKKCRLRIKAVKNLKTPRQKDGKKFLLQGNKV